MERVEIGLNKGRILKALVVSVILVVVGLAILLSGNSDILFNIIGIAVLLLGAWTTFNNGKKYMDKKPAVVIDKTGIFENSNTTSYGLIPWSDIKGMGDPVTIDGTVILPIFLVDDEKYIQQHKGNKKLLEIALNNIGSSVGIIVGTLDCSLGLLQNSVHQGLQKYKGE